MNRRSKRRRIAAVLLGAGLTTVAMAATVGGSASAEVHTKAPSQVVQPTPGSGVQVIIEAPPPPPPPPQPIGPRSLT
jgi:hypothetical protein